MVITAIIRHLFNSIPSYFPLFSSLLENSTSKLTIFLPRKGEARDQNRDKIRHLERKKEWMRSRWIWKTIQAADSFFTEGNVFYKPQNTTKICSHQGQCMWVVKCVFRCHCKLGWMLTCKRKKGISYKFNLGVIKFVWKKDRTFWKRQDLVKGEDFVF